MTHLVHLARCLLISVTLLVAANLAHAGPIELIGVGVVPGTTSDGLTLTPPVLEDGTPHDRMGGFGSAISYTGIGQRYLAIPDRGPVDGTTSYRDRYYLIDIVVTPGSPTPVAVSLVQATPLSREDGESFTGGSGAFDVANSPASLRFDPEGTRVSPAGRFFVSDEYGDRYPDPERALALKRFLAWGLTAGQSYSRELGYIPLPAEVASLSLAALDRIN